MNCDVIRDLLPLYHDGVCSAESVLEVEAHLPQCPPCRQALEEIRTEVGTQRVPTPTDVSTGEAMRALGRRWKRSRILVTITCVVLALFAMVVVIRAYQELFERGTVPVPAELVEVAELYRYKDGMIGFRLRFKDGKAADTSSWTSVRIIGQPSQTEFVRALRPRIILSTVDNALSGEMILQVQGNEWTDETKALYYGTPEGTEENFLIWEEGMEVPSATEEMERGHNVLKRPSGFMPL